MTSLKDNVKRQTTSVLRRYLGVDVGRAAAQGRVPANKHGDAALRRMRNWTTSDVVFDVGANDGRTILRINGLLNAPRIFAFEPVGSTYRQLVERTESLVNVTSFQFAIGDISEEKEIFVNRIHEMSSFSPAWGDPVGRETVTVKTLDQVCDELNVSFIHYLKIDTEGHELAVLRGAERMLSESRIAILQAEVGFDQLDKGMVSLESVRSFLAPYGYRLSGIYNQCHRRGNVPGSHPADEVRPDAAEVLAYVDAMFIRAD